MSQAIRQSHPRSQYNAVHLNVLVAECVLRQNSGGGPASQSDGYRVGLANSDCEIRHSGIRQTRRINVIH